MICPDDVIPDEVIETPLARDRRVVGAINGAFWEACIPVLSPEQWRGQMGTQLIDSFRTLIVNFLTSAGRGHINELENGGAAGMAGSLIRANRDGVQTVFDMFRQLPPLFIDYFLRARLQRILANEMCFRGCLRYIIIDPIGFDWIYRYGGECDRICPQSHCPEVPAGGFAMNALVSGVLGNSTATVVVEDLSGNSISESWELGTWRSNKSFTNVMIRMRKNAQVALSLPVMVWCTFDLELFTGTWTRCHRERHREFIVGIPIIPCQERMCHFRIPSAGTYY
jgi:hypothetical protein